MNTPIQMHTLTYIHSLTATQSQILAYLPYTLILTFIHTHNKSTITEVHSYTQVLKNHTLIVPMSEHSSIHSSKTVLWAPEYGGHFHHSLSHQHCSTHIETVFNNQNIKSTASKATLGRGTL